MRNIFLFLRRYFNFILFLLLQGFSIYLIIQYSNYHKAVFSKTTNQLTGKVNEQFNKVEYYFQLKKTQTTPSVKSINADVGKIDKPLCILWNIQQKKEGNINITSAGEYAIIPKEFFYKLLKNYIE